jgi:hypothetical protein
LGVDAKQTDMDSALKKAGLDILPGLIAILLSRVYHLVRVDTGRQRRADTSEQEDELLVELGAEDHTNSKPVAGDDPLNDSRNCLSLVLVQKLAGGLKIVFEFNSAIVGVVPHSLSGVPGLLLVDAELLDQVLVLGVLIALSGVVTKLDYTFSDNEFQQWLTVGQHDESMLAAGVGAYNGELHLFSNEVLAEKVSGSESMRLLKG